MFMVRSGKICALFLHVWPYAGGDSSIHITTFTSCVNLGSINTKYYGIGGIGGEAYEGDIYAKPTTHTYD